MTQQTDIKKLSNGSIDYAHYIAISKAIRRDDTNQALATIWRVLKAVWESAMRTK